MTAVFDFGMVWFSPPNPQRATRNSHRRPVTSLPCEARMAKQGNQPALPSPKGEGGRPESSKLAQNSLQND